MNEISSDWPLDQLRTELRDPRTTDPDDGEQDPGFSERQLNQLHLALSRGAWEEPCLWGRPEILDEVDALIGTASRIRPSFRGAVIRGARAGAQANRGQVRTGLVTEVLASIDEVLADQATPVLKRPVVNELRASVEAVKLGRLSPQDFAPEHLRELETMFQVSPEQFVTAGAQIRRSRAEAGAASLGITGTLHEPDDDEETAQWQAVLEQARALSDHGGPPEA